MSCLECDHADHAGMSGNPDRCTCDQPCNEARIGGTWHRIAETYDEGVRVVIDMGSHWFRWDKIEGTR